MKRTIEKLNNIAETFYEKTGRKVIAAQVFTNCLCLYFNKNGCRFFTKKGFNWGSVGSVYFVTINYSRESISKKLWSKHESLIKWFEEWSDATYVRRLWLMVEYNIRYS